MAASGEFCWPSAVSSKWPLTDPDTNEYADASARSADLYILCRHEGRDITEGWTFHVVGTEALNELGQASVRASTLGNAAVGPVELDGLEAAVREVARG